MQIAGTRGPAALYHLQPPPPGTRALKRESPAQSGEVACRGASWRSGSPGWTQLCHSNPRPEASGDPVLKNHQRAHLGVLELAAPPHCALKCAVTMRCEQQESLVLSCTLIPSPGCRGLGTLKGRGNRKPPASPTRPHQSPTDRVMRTETSPAAPGSPHGGGAGGRGGAGGAAPPQSA